MMLFLMLIFSAKAQAAQTGKVIVPSAKIYVYPQSTSRVVANLKQDQSVTISNVPTEGFFKIRAPNGEMGWISGNDVLAGNGASPAIPSASNTQINRRKALPHRPIREDAKSDHEGFRALIGYGIASLSYGGLTSSYSQVSLPSAKLLGFELQFKITNEVYWALRLETLSATTGDTTLNSTTTQNVTIKEIPVEVGVMWSPISSRKLRLGFGGYLGAVPSASATITQTSGGQVNSVQYSTTEICAAVAAQGVVGLGDAFGVFVDLAYRYDQSGTTPDTNAIGIVPGFKLNYSGITARAGLEIRL
jgi:hypothetical protein